MRFHTRCEPHNRLAWVLVLLVAGALPASAQTYISAEPIPDGAVVGTSTLAAIESLDYPTRAFWAQRLQGCGIVDNIIHALAENDAITTLADANTRYQVAAGGFQGVTDPSYVFTMIDSGPQAVSQSDVFVLDNTLGYALNQGGTAQFSLRYNPSNPYDFSNDYAVVTFTGKLTGLAAQDFFNYLGTIDAALWTGTNAGFTQIPLNPKGPYNSMLFLIGDVSVSEFESGLYEAATTTQGATYLPLDRGGPGVAVAGAAFPGNDWATYPRGDQYLVNIPSSPALLSELAALRQKHLVAVSNLVAAIAGHDVEHYLMSDFQCP